MKKNNLDFSGAKVMLCPRCNNDKVRCTEKYPTIVQCKKCFNWFTLGAAKYVNYLEYYRK